MPNRTGYVYDDLFLEYELEPFHPESALRLAALHAVLSESGLLEHLTSIAPLGDEEKVLRHCASVHTKEHIANVLECGATGRAALRAVAGIMAAVDAVCGKQVNNAFCALRPPGHHAHNSAHNDGICKGQGFCFFNNIAVAAKYAQAAWNMKNILIVDFDYHHGNGTEETFYSDPSVFYYSTHRLSTYPGTGHPMRKGRGPGAGYNLNIPLPLPDNPYGPVHDEHLINAFHAYLLPALEEVKFAPDMVLVSAGFDGREDDFLGDFSITDQGFAQITELTLELAGRHCDGRVVSTLEGGYNPEGLASAAIAHLKALLKA
ncbi:MAG: histone deacetylase [Chitinispirillaceae bacterium]|nr:histone deacetylase [Chitinispirillaceae bacterium]